MPLSTPIFIINIPNTRHFQDQSSNVLLRIFLKEDLNYGDASMIFFHTDYMYIKRALAIYYLIYNLKKHSINKNFNLIFVWLLQ